MEAMMYLSLNSQVSLAADDVDRLSFARHVLRGEAAALECVADRLDDQFLAAVDLIRSCTGRVVLTGTGKSADVAQKIAGTLNSTGTRSYVLDATRAVHGDLGMIHPDDVAIILSYSGESEEIVRLLHPLRQLARGLIAITGNQRSSLGRVADVVVCLGRLDEVCPLGMAPSTSTTAMIAVGDAIAFVLSRMRNFNHDDFARYHPAGSLGRKLMKVEAVMRRGSDLRIASCEESVREVFVKARRLGRRSGAVLLTDAVGRLRGIFTDSDLARLFEQRREASLDRPIREVMCSTPITVPLGTRVVDAVELLQQRKLSELPVLDRDGMPVGLLDITDLIGLWPVEEPSGADEGAGEAADADQHSGATRRAG
jgi:arabinose-5-phosphate isomerase